MRAPPARDDDRGRRVGEGNRGTRAAGQRHSEDRQRVVVDTRREESKAQPSARRRGGRRRGRHGNEEGVAAPTHTAPGRQRERTTSPRPRQRRQPERGGTARRVTKARAKVRPGEHDQGVLVRRVRSEEEADPQGQRVRRDSAYKKKETTARPSAEEERRDGRGCQRQDTAGTSNAGEQRFKTNQEELQQGGGPQG